LKESEHTIRTACNKRFGAMAVGAESEVLPRPLTAFGSSGCGAPHPPRSPSHRALCDIDPTAVEHCDMFFLV